MMRGRTLALAVGLAAALPYTARANGPQKTDDPDVIVLNTAGDVAWPDGWGGIGHIDEQQSKLFSLVEPILASGDLNFANLECPFTTTRAMVKKTYPITCHPKRLAYAVDAGFNLLSLANNHSLDAGKQGIVDTHALLNETNTKERPLWWAGTGATADEAKKPVVFTPPGKNARIAFFAVANSGPNNIVDSVNDPELPARIAAAAKEADIVLVSIHYGPEYVHVPSAHTVERNHALIDAGATAVISHHPHVVQGVERYKHGIIFYSLGNFSFGSHTRRHLETGARLYSMIGRITFRKGAIEQVELVPLYANNSYKWPLQDKTLDPRHATPQLLRGEFAQAAMDELEDFTAKVPTDTPTVLVRVGDRLFVDLGAGGPKLADQSALLHEQHHDYVGCASTGSVPRPATAQEMAWENTAGTPKHRPPPKALAKKKANKRRGKAQKGKKGKATRAARRKGGR